MLLSQPLYGGVVQFHTRRTHTPAVRILDKSLTRPKPRFPNRQRKDMATCHTALAGDMGSHRKVPDGFPPARPAARPVRPGQVNKRTRVWAITGPQPRPAGQSRYSF